MIDYEMRLTQIKQRNEEKAVLAKLKEARRASEVARKRREQEEKKAAEHTGLWTPPELPPELPPEFPPEFPSELNGDTRSRHAKESNTVGRGEAPESGLPESGLPIEVAREKLTIGDGSIERASLEAEVIVA